MLTYTAQDPTRLARFWAGVLGRGVVEHETGVSLPGSDTQLGLRFVPGPVDPVGRHRMHVHLTSDSLADQQQTVARVLGLGGRHLDVGQLPHEEHVVMADPEGNELCVIEPGNSFLSGCGLLGELACDGSREVGVFWSRALDWPLVWDQDQETAIQSPRGGTKVAWGGPSDASLPDEPRHRFHLLTTGGDLAFEADRLVSLGATGREGSADGTILMADPDGNEFRVTVA
jgi:hypothetical protein